MRLYSQNGCIGAQNKWLYTSCRLFSHLIYLVMYKFFLFVVLFFATLVFWLSGCKTNKATQVQSIAHDRVNTHGRLPDSIYQKAKDLDAFITASGLSGGVLIEKNGEIILGKGYGWANRDSKELNDVHTVFNIGSISKQFTATAILKLNEMNKLQLSDTLGKFFPNVPRDKSEITVHQLLSHTAGFKRVVVERTEHPKRDEYVNTVLGHPLMSRPGEKYAYSNTAYSLLAVIIEKASNLSYEQFLRKQLWLPAGMKNTGFVLPNWSRKDWAYAYKSKFLIQSPNFGWDSDGPTWPVRGPGEVLSTLEDIYKWNNALAGELIVSASRKEKLFSPQVTIDEEASYGYGWVIDETPRKTKRISHDGTNGFYFANLNRYVDEGVLVVNYTNELSPYSERILNSIGGLFFRQLPVFPKPLLHLTEKELTQYTGIYQLETGDTISIVSQGGVIVVPTMTSFIAKHLTAFPISVDSLPMKNIDSVTFNLIKNLASGDITEVEKDLDIDGPVSEEQEYWKKEAIRRKDYGSFKTSQILGVTSRRNLPLIYVLAQFENGYNLFQLRLNQKNKFYVGTSNDLLPDFYRLIPHSSDNFKIYNAALITDVTLAFNRDINNLVSAVSIYNGNKVVKGKKLTDSYKRTN